MKKMNNSGGNGPPRSSGDIVARQERLWAGYADDLLEEVRAPGPAAEARKVVDTYIRDMRRAADLAISKHERRIASALGITGRGVSELDAACWLMEQAVVENWGPLLLGFMDWVWGTIRPDQVPVAVLRSAGPMLYLSQQSGGSPLGRKCEKLYLSRRLLGVQDLWSGQYKGEVEPKTLLQYLGRMGVLDDERIVLVDSGVYGAIPRRLSETPFSTRLESRFLWSRNPFIPGWLNILGVPDVVAEIVMDSLEFWPKKYRLATRLEKSTLVHERIPRPILHETSEASQRLYRAVGRGLERSQRPTLRRRPVGNCQTEEGFRAIEFLLGRVHQYHVQARYRGLWTSVLAAPLPASQRVGWVGEYPAELADVNPEELLPHGYPRDRRVVNPRFFGM